MNGYATSAAPYSDAGPDHYAPSSPPPPPQQRRDPRFNPGAQQDSMALHLLVEQAIFDAAEYEVLPFEEVESLKKEAATLRARIDTATRKLAMESKVRDAALSLARLSKGRRSGGGAGGEELAASSRKCDDLSAELAKLQPRAAEVQQRLLQHSAGILGMTHKVGERGRGGGGARGEDGGGGGNGEYMLANGKAVVDPQAFDDRSFYKTVDKLDGFGETPRSNGVVAAKAVEEEFLAERLKDLNSQIYELLRSSSESQPPRLSGGGQGGVHEHLALLDENIQFLRQHPPAALPRTSPSLSRAAEQLERTEATMMNLWDMIISFDDDVRAQKKDQRQKGYHDPDSDGDEGKRLEFSVSAFSSQVQKMLNKAVNLRGERDMYRDQSDQHERSMEEDMKLMQEELRSMGGQVEELSTLLKQREDDLGAANGKVHGLVDELKKLQTALDETKDELKETEASWRETADELEESRMAFGKKSEEFLNVMHELDAERSTDKKRAIAANEGLVQEHTALELANEARAEMEKQLDELDKKLAVREEELMELEIKYQETKEDRDLTRAELEALVAETDARLKNLDEEIAQLKKALRASEEARNASAEQESRLQQQLETKERKVQNMDEEIQELSQKVAQLSTEVVMARAELDMAYGSKSERAAATAEAKAAAAALERANKQPQTIDPGLLAEIENLERKNEELIDEILALKTERAEGANKEHTGGGGSSSISLYSGRSSSSTNGNNDHLQKRCKMLQRELDDMLKDFENLTKQSIEAEQERSKLESTIDKLREKVDDLETSLAEERIRLLGVPRNQSTADIRTPVGRGFESTTTNVLKQEFKKMMRDMRADQSRALRAEQEERRRLESTIRNLKKEQLVRRMTPPAGVS